MRLRRHNSACDYENRIVGRILEFFHEAVNVLLARLIVLECCDSGYSVGQCHIEQLVDQQYDVPFLISIATIQVRFEEDIP